MLQKIVLASGNRGKLKELKLMLADQKIEIAAQSEFDLQTPEETGLTFVENAILKARYVTEKTGLPAIADDSGIEVDALNGEPGIYSARYAGEEATDKENLNKLLFEMREVDDDNRQCRFHCVIVLMRFAADPTPLICHGSWEGRLLRQPTGENGFGYDPVFLCSRTRMFFSTVVTRNKKISLVIAEKALRELVQKLNV